MAWIDDRIWCHGKFADLSDHAFSTYIKSVAYSSGLNCRGYLTLGQQKLVGTTDEGRKELLNAGLWDKTTSRDTVYIHDWDEHNSKRDDRRERDRERKRKARASSGMSADKQVDAPGDTPLDAPQETGGTFGRTSATAARVDGSEGSEGSEGTTKPTFLPSVAKDAKQAEGRQNLLDKDKLNPAELLAHANRPPF